MQFGERPYFRMNKSIRNLTLVSESQVACTCEDGDIKILDIQSGEELQNVQAFPLTCSCGNIIYSYGDGIIRIIDITDL